MKPLTPRAARRTLVAILSTLLVTAAACGSGSSDTDSASAGGTASDTSMEGSHHDDHTSSDSGHGHDHGDHAATAEVDAADAPSVSFELVDNGGVWSVEITTERFEIVPEDAVIDDPVTAGHAHVYLDGIKLGRAYTTSYELGEVPAGDHTVRVELSTHDHRVLSVDGVPVDMEMPMTVAGEVAPGPVDAVGDPTEFDAEIDAAESTIEVVIEGGEVVSDSGRVEVAAGSVVAVLVTTDEAHEVHVHGYDILRTAPSGRQSGFAFVADIPGVFEVELESSGSLVVELLVR